MNSDKKKKNTSRVLMHGVVGLASLAIARGVIYIPLETLKTQTVLEFVSELEFVKYFLIHDEKENEKKDNEEAKKRTISQYYSPWKENLLLQFSQYFIQRLSTRYISPVTPIPQVISTIVTHPIEITHLLTVMNERSNVNFTWRESLLNKSSLPLAVLHSALYSSLSQYFIQPKLLQYQQQQQQQQLWNENDQQFTIKLIANTLSRMLLVPLEVTYKRQAIDSITKTNVNSQSLMERKMRPAMWRTVLKTILLTLVEEPSANTWYYIYTRIMRS